MRWPASSQSRTIPLHTSYLHPAAVQQAAARARSGLLTRRAKALLWTGLISIDQAVTITFPVVISPTAARFYVLTHASLDDGKGNVRPLEAYT